MQGKNIIFFITAIMLLGAVSPFCRAEDESLYGILDALPDQTTSQSGYVNEKGISLMLGTRTRQLDEAVQILESVKSQIEGDKNAIKSQLKDINRRIDILEDEKDRIEDQLDTANKQIKTINSVKGKLKKNIWSNNHAGSSLNPFR